MTRLALFSRFLPCGRKHGDRPRPEDATFKTAHARYSAETGQAILSLGRHRPPPTRPPRHRRAQPAENRPHQRPGAWGQDGAGAATRRPQRHPHDAALLPVARAGCRGRGEAHPDSVTLLRFLFGAGCCDAFLTTVIIITPFTYTTSVFGHAACYS